MSISPRRSVVIVGAGKIGCAYFAPMFLDAGWKTVLAVRTEAHAERVRTTAFEVRLADEREPRTLSCPAVPSSGDGFDAAVAEADLVVVTVGFQNIRGLGPGLARALAARGPSSPLDVWVVENSDAGPELEGSVRTAAAGAGLALPPVGFPGAIAYTVVAHGTWEEGVRPMFVGDGVDTLLVDETRLVRPLTRLPGVTGTVDYQARLREKIFLFGAGHAICAYLGARTGYERVDEAAQDPLIRTLVRESLLESRSALVRAYPALEVGMWHSGDAIGALGRYSDPRLEDPIRRVARNPVRKLAPDGPLVGAAKLVENATGRIHTAFALGIASALLYRDEADAQADQLAALLHRAGVPAVLREVCGLDPSDSLGRAVLAAHKLLASDSPGFVRSDPRVAVA